VITPSAPAETCLAAARDPSSAGFQTSQRQSSASHPMLIGSGIETIGGHGRMDTGAPSTPATARSHRAFLTRRLRDNPSSPLFSVVRLPISPRFRCLACLPLGDDCLFTESTFGMLMAFRGEGRFRGGAVIVRGKAARRPSIVDVVTVCATPCTVSSTGDHAAAPGSLRLLADDEPLVCHGGKR